MDMMKRLAMSPRRIARGLVVATGFTWAVPSQASAPDTISPPEGLNLGSTSFYDGFGRESEGWSIVEYGRYESLNSINGPGGTPNPTFKGAHIVVAVALTQAIYTTAWEPFGGHFAFSAALPVIDFAKSQFAHDSPVSLNNNGTGIGDLVWGPIFQSRVYTDGAQPVFVWRAQFIISSPTGAVNASRSINQGAGYWQINPYVTFTYFPLAGFELSNRFNYQYNLIGTEFSNPPPIPHLVYRNGQGGQILYDNFAGSYSVLRALSVGLDGYMLDELTPDRTNGQTVSKSLKSEVYLGPGVHITLSDADWLNLNTYFKLVSNNAVSGPQFNVQFIHRL
jgi:hypothetical protein